MVAVNKVGTDIEPLLAGAEKTVVVQTTWGDLDAEIDKEIAKARESSSGSSAPRRGMTTPITGPTQSRGRFCQAMRSSMMGHGDPSDRLHAAPSMRSPLGRGCSTSRVVVCIASDLRGGLMSTDTLAEKAEHADHADGVIDHLTTAERVAVGRSAREALPRGSHASWEPPPHRRDPVELLEEQAATRVSELVPIRYGRMLTSPFAFYRGAALLMAADLAGTPRTTLTVQLCGDAHLSNFGGFAAPDRRLVFSVNDFDETLPGPFEWDLKRLVASCAVAGRAVGFGPTEREVVNLAVVRSYRQAMSGFAQMRTLDTWYTRLDADQFRREWDAGATKAEKKGFKRSLAKSRTKDSMKAFDKLTRLVDGEPRIISDPPLIVPINDLLGPGPGPGVRRRDTRHHPLVPTHPAG